MWRVESSKLNTHILVHYNILNFWFNTCHQRQSVCWTTLDLDYMYIITCNYFRYFKKYTCNMIYVCLHTNQFRRVHFFFNQWICSRLNIFLSWDLKLSSNGFDFWLLLVKIKLYEIFSHIYITSTDTGIQNWCFWWLNVVPILKTIKTEIIIMVYFHRV